MVLHPQDLGRTVCCSEKSFCTTAEDEQEAEGGRHGDAESTLSATETKSISGSEAMDHVHPPTDLQGVHSSLGCAIQEAGLSQDGTPRHGLGSADDEVSLTSSTRGVDSLAVHHTINDR